MTAICAQQWNECANPDPATCNPFISHAFLRALEDAETVAPRTGWQPQHLVIKDGNDIIQGCMPLYAKSHSKGEYVFDYGWADAFERAGGNYYPKLVSAVPFTPVPGRRILAKPGKDAGIYEDLLLQGAIELTSRYDLSSLHINFLPEQQWHETADSGFLQRTDQQFHWQNQGFGTFDDFLSNLASRKRKAVRKERMQAIANGLSIEHFRGNDITEEHWDAMYMFYTDTGNRKWGRPYLNRTFFSLLGETMPEECLLILVSRDGNYIGGALNIVGGNCLFGRYWGAIEHHPCLHFEICYYQAIEFAIQNKLERVEAGAQGEHKLARGYMPTATYSSHYIPNPSFRRAISSYLDEERSYAERSREILAQYGPYRRDTDDSDQI